jgi:hypothetical protein
VRAVFDGDETMIIYAIFLCIAGSCQRADPGRYSDAFGVIPGAVYATRAACERELPPSLPALKFVCLGRKIETWQ